MARPTGQYKATNFINSMITYFAANDLRLTILSQAPQGKYSSKVAGGVKEEW